VAQQRVTETQTDLYGVIGHPVAHSYSPFIHMRFAAQTGEKILYERFDVAPDQFADGIRALIDKRGLKGANVTLPHKLAAFEFCDSLSDSARIAGAVNTVRVETDGTTYGDNTDGSGLVCDLTNNLNVKIAGSAVLMLGASGAARGALKPLLDEKPARLVIANRTPERAVELAEAFQEYAGDTELSGGGARATADGRYDIIINATSAGHQGAAPEIASGALHPQTVCYDMVYGQPAIPFVRAVIALGASRIFEGWGMLTEQAADSFACWRGKRPDTGPVLNALIASYLAAVSQQRNDS
jgi:shikimate dehydrogenase